MNRNAHRVTVCVPSALLERLDREACAQRRSRSNMLSLALASFFGEVPRRAPADVAMEARRG